jgi:hypothetical protein
VLTEIVILGNRNVIKKETEKVLTYEFLTVVTQHMWNLKMITVIIGATGNVRIIQKIPNQRAWKAQHAENCRTGHCAHTSESTNVQLQNVCRGN